MQNIKQNWIDAECREKKIIRRRIKKEIKRVRNSKRQSFLAIFVEATKLAIMMILVLAALWISHSIAFNTYEKEPDLLSEPSAGQNG